MNNNFKMLDWITLISFGIGLYALYIALENLWENANQVKRELGYCAENIRSVCRGVRQQANGYKWKYKEE